MAITRRRLILTLATVASVPVLPASARRGRGGRDDDDHHERGHHDHVDADTARKQGEVRPLQEILDEVELQMPGEVVGVEFDRKDGVWVYEIKKLTKTGQYMEIYVDASTKQIIKIEGK